MLPFFRDSVKIPVSIDRLKIKQRCIGIAPKASFSNLELKPSMAEDLEIHIRFIAFNCFLYQDSVEFQVGQKPIKRRF